MTVSELDMKNKSPNFLQSAFNGSQFSAKDYVQDGLLAMYDGIENAGFGMHDPSAATWKDLANSYDLIVPSSLTWHDQFLELDGARCAYNLALPHSAIGTTWTCECVYSIEETGTNYKGLFGCRLNTGGGGWCQVYGLNFWSSVKDGWNMGNGSSPDIVISENAQLKKLVEVGRKNYLVLGQLASGKLVAGTDGLVSVEKSASAVDTSHSGIMLGRAYESPTAADASRCLKSKIYAFRLYNRALSDTEIASNYAIDAKRFELTTGEDA